MSFSISGLTTIGGSAGGSCTSLVSLEILLLSSRVESVSGGCKLSVEGIAGVAEEFLSDDAIGEVTVEI